MWVNQSRLEGSLDYLDCAHLCTYPVATDTRSANRWNRLAAFDMLTWHRHAQLATEALCMIHIVTLSRASAPPFRVPRCLRTHEQCGHHEDVRFNLTIAGYPKSNECWSVSFICYNSRLGSGLELEIKSILASSSSTIHVGTAYAKRALESGTSEKPAQ